MEKLSTNEPQTQSADILAEGIKRLKYLFPEVVTEGKIDFEVLRRLLGDAVDEREEKYGLNWHGKRRARQLSLTPSTGALRPCPEESVDWNTTQNLMIEGDNLEVLKLLQKSYAGKVKLIYIDPPYNTGKDFVYPDDFQDNIKNYLELTGQAEGGKKISSNTEASGRFHTDWLNMMYPRLRVARNLLREDGVIWISIDDIEVSNLREVCDEIFGEENFVATFIWEKRKTRENRKVFSFNHDYIVCYAREKDVFQVSRNLLPLTAEARARYTNPDNDPRGDWQSVALTAQAGHGTAAQFYTIVTPSGRRVDPPSGNCWRVTESKLKEMISDNRIWFGAGGNNVPRQKVFLAEQDEGLTPHTLWTADEVGTTDSAKRKLNDLFVGVTVFDTPKPVELIERIVRISMGPDDIALDFFAGCAPLSESIMSTNTGDKGTRKYISVQLPEKYDDSSEAFRAGYKTIAAVTKERLRRAGRKIRDENPLFSGDLGFRVFKLDSTNIRAWEPVRDNMPQTLLDNVEHIKPGRTEADILYELLLKLGLDLCVPIEERMVAGKTVHNIGAGTLLVCLAPQITREEVEELALGMAQWHKELTPAGESTCVFRDSAFADDVAKANLTAILQQYGLENVRSL